jgi:hypothetical protein
MVSRKISICLVLMAVLVIPLGCTAPDAQQAPADDKVIMEEFNQLAAGKGEVAALVEFITDNIGQVTAENASLMVVRLEEAQKENLPQLEAKFFADANLQTQLSELAEPQFEIDLSGADQIELAEVRELLLETRDTGYKVETAEGMFFPIIDYQFYQEYSPHVTADMQEYIAIMATESDAVPAKDAALVIGWDEVVARAQRMAQFIEEYPDSIRADQVKELYDKYIIFTLFGLNNTPLFDYNTNTMVEEAEDVYRQAAAGSEDNAYLELLQDYLKVLEENNYKLTAEVDQYRKDITK